MTTLDEFLAPFDPAEFRNRYLGRGPLHFAASRRSLPNPLPWKRFNEILEISHLWNEDMLKVFYRNRLALRENYCDVTDVAPGAKALADPRKVKAQLGFGASLVANHIQRASPEVAAIVRMLQREFSAGAGANAYCSFKGVQAFGTHFDLHDVFALQVEGEKLWRIYEARADNPTAPVPPGDEAEKWLVDTRGRVIAEVQMKPGDMLYLPRGQYHDALTGAGASLHVTFWVKRATGLSLFKLLEAAAATESGFRADLPSANDTAALGQHLARLGQRLRELMTSPAFALDVKNHQRAYASAPAAYELPAQRRPTYYSTTKRSVVLRRDDGFTVQIDGKPIDLGATYPAVAWLLQRRLFSFDDLLAGFPFLDESELRAVLQELIGAGAIVETEMR
jgi:lysine-specific demethylase/histidyl-hydroxylase NO66